jgi:polyhydroxybutyrate depolymerase
LAAILFISALVIIFRHAWAVDRATANLHSSLNVGGVTRTYLLHLPPQARNTKTALPIVIVFHGFGGQGEGMAHVCKFDAVADREGFIVVYPDGLRRQWSYLPEDPKTGDVAFVRAIIEKTKQEYSVDSSRIYATGISNGGFFAQRVGYELHDQIAAVASVAATLPQAWATGMKENKYPHPLPIMFMQGTDDPLIPINGGSVGDGLRRGQNTNRAGRAGNLLSLQEAVTAWVNYDNCDMKPMSTNLRDTNPDDGTTVRTDIYSNGKQNSEVVVFTIKGGGHCWPGGVQYLPEQIIGKTSRDINASEEIWKFFSRHPKL